MVEKPVRWSKDRLAKLEDLELALDAAVHVNRYLNKEIEAVVQQLQRAEQERHAWQEHARRLARQLAKYKRAAAGNQQQQQQQQRHTVEEADDAQLQQLADELAQLPHSNGSQDAAAAADADLQQQQQQALVSPGAFPWEDMLDSISTLVHKGREAGWLAAPSEVKMGNVLGQGAFGTTYMAHWRGAQVAVKCVTVRSEAELLNFLREVECLAALRHPNVVPFLGAVLQDQGRCWLISEFMPGGTLAQWLHGDKGPLGPNKPLLQRAQRALDVCRALAALEACAPPLLHRDVKPSNVFMDGSGTARLGDFGLARPMPTSRATLTGETGTYLYMSPEMVRHEVYDSKTDVWSFGVLLAELLTGHIPYQHTFMTPVQIAMGVADEKLQPLLPGQLPTELLVLCHACCDFDPDMRPGFATLVEELEGAVATLQKDAEAAAAGGLFGRLRGNRSIPSSWASVLGQVGS